MGKTLRGFNTFVASLQQLIEVIFVGILSKLLLAQSEHGAQQGADQSAS
ncbi:hypothetical protein ACT691_05975 [Vibrio metschnikovii]